MKGGENIMDKKALYNLSYGLFVLTVCENGKDNGGIINTAIQVSSSPNNMCISVNKANSALEAHNERYKKLREAGLLVQTRFLLINI